MNELVTFTDMERMAHAVAKGGLLPIKDPAAVLSLMMISQASGHHPAAILMDYDLIQGRPSKKAQAMLRDFQKAGGTVTWHERTDTVADATFSHPSGGRVRVDWTLERAKQAGLLGKQTWQQYPRAMLHARCVSEGVRAVFPGATGGLYTPEEIVDLEPPPTPEEIDITPVKLPLDEESIQEHLNAISIAPDMESLKAAFSTAWSEAKRVGDADALRRFEAAKDDVKRELEDAA